MWKIALVGHSQIPQRFSFPGAQVRIFRAPGGKASAFFDDSRLNEILNWEQDLTIVWIGSNDVTSNTDPDMIFDHIKGICYAIKDNCQYVVYACQIEPRLHPRGLSPQQYKKIQSGINNRIKKRLGLRNIHFNNIQFVEELHGDGVHWSEAGPMRVESKFRKVIKRFIGEDDSDE